MSVRIQNDQAPGITSPQTGGADRSSSPHSTPGKNGVSSESSSDRVDVSSVAESISSGISAHNLSHANRVAHIKSALAAGQYIADSAQVSRALIGNAITGTAAGKA